MEAITILLLESGFANLTWMNLVMFIIGGILIYLAIRKGYEPLLLIPIGFGAILANLPHAMLSASNEATAASHDGVRCGRARFRRLRFAGAHLSARSCPVGSLRYSGNS